MKRYASGFSLVELLIGVALGAVLMTGIVQVFLSSRAGFASEQALSKLQETGRLGIEFMAKDIRMAGYSGCAGAGATVPMQSTLNQSSSFRWNMLTPIQGYSIGTIANADLAAAGINTALNTDAFVVTNFSPFSVNASKANTADNVFGILTTQEAGACSDNSTRLSGFCSRDILMISDCEQAIVFQASAISVNTSQLSITHTVSTNPPPGNATVSWLGHANNLGNNLATETAFDTSAEITKVSRITYFIAVSATTNRSTLYQNQDGVNTELLDGVENMSITYGLDTLPNDGQLTPTKYSLAKDIAPAEWANVRSVRIELLVVSAEVNAVEASQTYIFNNNKITKNDGRLRQVFISTTGIRSRLP